MDGANKPCDDVTSVTAIPPTLHTKEKRRGGGVVGVDVSGRWPIRRHGRHIVTGCLSRRTCATPSYASGKLGSLIA